MKVNQEALSALFSMKNADLSTKLSDLRKLDICAYGVRVRIESDIEEHLEKILGNLPLILPERYEFFEGEVFDIHFHLTKLKNGLFRVYRNDEIIPSDEKTEEYVLPFFLNHLRLTIAEHAVSKVFIHAGVVGWKGKAIILPGKSHAGKTTFVSELIKKGAEYYSDEYAVLDENGLVHPFPKMLAVRPRSLGGKSTNVSFEEFGAVEGTKPIPAGLILFANYKKGSIWNLEMLTQGEGMLEIIPHTIPIRFNPDFALKTLNKTLIRAKIAKTNREDAKHSADLLMEYVETKRVI